MKNARQNPTQQNVAHQNFINQIASKRGYFVQDFLNYLAIERNLSLRTVKEYEYDLKIFFQYFKPMLEQDLTLDAIDERTLREFLTYLKLQKNYLPRALNRKISTLKNYFRFLENEGYIEKSPLTYMKSVKMGREIPKVLTQQEVKTLLNTADNPPDKGKRPYKTRFDIEVRDRAMLELFYATGIRIGELHGLDIEDINFDQNMIKVTGKGNKQRMVLMNNTAREALEDYLQIRPPTPHRAVFINNRLERLSIRMVQNIFKIYMKFSGIQKTASPHTLRHSFATHLLEGGADLVSIKELLGHESLATTQIYTNIAMERIKKVYTESHPRS